MGLTSVTAVVLPKKNEDGSMSERLSTTFDYNLPDSVEDAVEEFGEDVVLSIINQQVKIKVQAAARIKMQQGKANDEIQKWAGTYKPGLAAERKSNLDRIAEAMAKLTPEERKALREKIAAQQTG
jgi:hypothetical protein